MTTAAKPGPTLRLDQSRSAAPSNLVVLDLKNELEAGRLCEFGLSLEQIKIIAGDSLECERELRIKLLGEGPIDVPARDGLDRGVLEKIMNSGVRNLPYIETILGSGHFLTVCPASGRQLKSDASFVLDTHHVAYRFTGDVVFFLVVGRFHGRRAALSVPSRNVLVTLDVPERGPAISRWVSQIMGQLIGISLTQPALFQTRIKATTSELTLVMGGMDNFGHHVWQELAGIAQVLALGRLPRVRSLLLGPHNWFKIEKVFPELADCPQTKCATAQEMLIKGLTQPGTILRPVALQITADLRHRLKRSVAVELGPEQMERISKAGAQRRLVWINLRAHNKMWKSQVDGYAGLLNRLYQENENIGVVYDGWRDTAKIRDEIDAKLNAGIIRHDTLGVPMEVSLAWAEAITTYVSVVGSGLVLNSWLVQKPGIAHANRAHLGQRIFWNNVSEGMIPVTFVDAKEISCDGTLYGNYDFDWRILLPEMRSNLAVTT